MSSQRELLLAQVATDLAAIDGTGSYTNRVEKVSRDLLVPSAVGVYPCIVMDAGEETVSIASSHRYHLNLPLTLFAYFQSDGTEPVDTQHSAWLADLKVCMVGTTNFHHGNYAEWTRYESSEIVPEYISGVQVLVANFLLGFTHTKDVP